MFKKFIRKGGGFNRGGTRKRGGEAELITVPFRYAEAARVSIYTIAGQPGIPEYVREWVSQWLDVYNAHLIAYMQKNYGQEIFPLLDQITRDVMPGGKSPDDSGLESSWDRWEKEFREES